MYAILKVTLPCVPALALSGCNGVCSYLKFKPSLQHGIQITIQKEGQIEALAGEGSSGGIVICYIWLLKGVTACEMNWLDIPGSELKDKLYYLLYHSHLNG